MDLVLEVDDRDIIHQLYVEGSNGVRWYARAWGAKIVHRFDANLPLNKV